MEAIALYGPGDYTHMDDISIITHCRADLEIAPYEKGDLESALK